MKTTMCSVLLALVACAPLPAAQTPPSEQPGQTQSPAQQPPPTPPPTQQTTQTPPVATPPQSSTGPRVYRVGPRDTLKIDFIGVPPEDQDMNRTYPVQSNGTIDIKYLESVKVEGLTLLEIGALIGKQIEERGLYRSGQLRPSVTMAGFRDFEVQVGGAVRTPGNFRLSGDNNSVNRAINLAGGWASNAGFEVEIIRAPVEGQAPEPPIIITRAQLDMNDDPGLRENDRVIVKMGLVFFVNGEVNAQGEKRWEPGMTVAQALAAAGGQTPKFSLNRSRIERPVKDKDGRVIKYDKIKDLRQETPIQAGDILVAGRKLM